MTQLNGTYEVTRQVDCFSRCSCYRVIGHGEDQRVIHYATGLECECRAFNYLRNCRHVRAATMAIANGLRLGEMMDVVVSDRVEFAR